MKKTLILFAAFVLAIGVTGCSKSSEDTTADTATEQTEQAEQSKTAENEALDNIDADADKNIDMTKVEGTDAQVVDDSSAKGTVGDTQVEVTDAKVIKYNEQDVIVVNYEFKNKTGEETTFNMVEDANASQSGDALAVATVIGVDGIDCNTLGQRVANGEKITVQKAFRLKNLTDDVTVTVDDASVVSETAPVSKTFKISQ